MTPPLIALTGYSRSGKDTTARLLAERFRVARLAFADALKSEIASAWAVDPLLFYDDELKDRSLEQLALRHCTNDAFVAAHWHLSPLDALKPRTLMQTWADWRKAADPSCYVRALAGQLDIVLASGPQAVIVTDARNPEEYPWLLQCGARIWRVTKPGQSLPSGHSSEKSQIDWQVDAEIVNSGSFEQLAKIATDLFLGLLEETKAAHA